jgi:tRNA1(Val) A37 N6-methylase TrmN6
VSVTEGALLDGRLRYRQFSAGHRSGFEPVLLAAAAPARPGESVIEFGTGAGAALLCLAHRVPGITGLGLEIDPATASLANENFKINNLQNLSAIQADARAGAPKSGFDHAISNPPWHDEAGTTSPDSARARAHHADATLLEDWIAQMIASLKPRGHVTLILPAASLSRAIAALRAGAIGAITLLPLWPRAGKPAGMFILSGRHNAKTPDRLLPGLTLHNESGITQEANAILRDGAALSLGADVRKQGQGALPPWTPH